MSPGQSSCESPARGLRVPAWRMHSVIIYVVGTRSSRSEFAMSPPVGGLEHVAIYNSKVQMFHLHPLGCMIVVNCVCLSLSSFRNTVRLFEFRCRSAFAYFTIETRMSHSRIGPYDRYNLPHGQRWMRRRIALVRSHEYAISCL